MDKVDKVTNGNRGCVFFNFGASRAIQLFVALHSLREVYQGPITLFLIKDDPHQDRLGAQIKEAFNVSLFWINRPQSTTRSNNKQISLQFSPYRATIAFDSDLLFLKPIDPLWEPLEEKGVLLTRFSPNPYGIDGNAENPGFANRVQHLNDIKHLLSDDEYRQTIRQLLVDEIDVNTGVVGHVKGKGDAFLQDWIRRIEQGVSIILIDEILAVSLLHRYPHFLADEKWNCPADEFFRKTNLRDAAIIHYFADGTRLRFGNIVLGRAGHTWASTKWFSHFYKVRSEYKLSEWCKYDNVLCRSLPYKVKSFAERTLLSTKFGQRLRMSLRCYRNRSF
jgi:hypothetical protein